MSDEENEDVDVGEEEEEEEEEKEVIVDCPLSQAHIRCKFFCAQSTSNPNLLSAVVQMLLRIYVRSSAFSNLCCVQLPSAVPPCASELHDNSKLEYPTTISSYTFAFVKVNVVADAHRRAPVVSHSRHLGPWTQQHRPRVGIHTA